ncbi:hypothetical protein LPJ60_006513, partial [Coemansia sp. RSA 2675]
MTTLELIKLTCGSVTASFDVALSNRSVVQDLARSFSPNATELSSAIELHAAFIEHCARHDSADATLAVFDAFCQAHGTANSDIHVVIQSQSLDSQAAQRVLRGYYSVWPITRHRALAVPLPALFSADSVSLMAVFGGQRGFGDTIQEA